MKNRYIYDLFSIVILMTACWCLYRTIACNRGPDRQTDDLQSYIIGRPQLDTLGPPPDTRRIDFNLQK